MKCEVGVHTGRITLQFSEHDWANAKMLVNNGEPARVGHRLWLVQERDGGILASQSTVGTVPNSSRRGDVIIRNDSDTIVRCHTHEREVEFPRRGHLFVPMPPHHLWPWIKDSKSRHKEMTPERWRGHLVREINARTRSFVQFVVRPTPEWHGVSQPELPMWVLKMLTAQDLIRIRNGDEI